MLLRIVFVVAFLLLAVLGLAALKPPRLKIERSVVINAPVDKVYGLVNDFHNWKEWAPGDKDDPTIQRSYSGAASGVGAASDWQGRGSTGAGHMAITGGAQDAQVEVTVDFARPFVAHNVNTFWIKAAAASGPTKVTWNFDGQNVYMLKLMGLFMNMDHFMGRHFEQGLQNLKAAAEK